MQDFLGHLEARLVVMAVASEAPVTSRLSKRHRRAPLAACGLTSLLTVAGVLALTGTSTADLPILATPTTDASSVGVRVAGAAKLGVDFSAAHRFNTPGGPGYVVAGITSDAVCIVLPDPTAPGVFGTSCAPSLAHVEQHGLRAEFPGDLAMDPGATAASAFVLPDGAEDVRLTVGGKTTKPRSQSGVIVTDLATEGRLRWNVDGRAASKVLEGPFPAGEGVQRECPDGRTIVVPVPPDSPSPGEISEALGAAVKKACAR